MSDPPVDALDREVGYLHSEPQKVFTRVEFADRVGN